MIYHLSGLKQHTYPLLLCSFILLLIYNQVYIHIIMHNVFGNLICIKQTYASHSKNSNMYKLINFDREVSFIFDFNQINVCLYKYQKKLQQLITFKSKQQQKRAMPPKALPRNRKSQSTSQDFIPIYDILSDKDRQQVVRQLSKKLEMIVNSSDSVEKSFIVFVMKVCGLDQSIEKMNWRSPLQSLSDLLEEMCEQNQKTTIKSQLLLINFKSKFHKQFLSRIKHLLQITISDQLSLITQSQFMKKVFQTLLVISKCKMRNIRQSSVLMSELIMKRSKLFFDQLTNLKSNKRASKILSLIDEGYLEQIIRPRLRDIDIKIRQKAFEITGQTLLSFPHQLINVKKLSDIYSQILIENKTKITQLCLKSIVNLFQADKQKIGLIASKNLTSYAMQIIKPIQELVLLPNRNSCLAMDVLLAIHNFNSSLNSLKPKIIAKVFQIHGYENYHEGLKKIVSIFLKSLISFQSKDDLKQHRSLLQIQIIHLLCSINSSKLISTILNEFFNLYENLFDFDQMFLLLFTEYYHQNSSDVQLQDKQLSVVCTMISQFNSYLRNNKLTPQRQKQQQAYNKNVLTNCKQIVYQKVAKHPLMSHLYFRLFARLYTPISGDIQNYMSFVEQRILNFVRQEKFFSISGDNLVLMQQILNQCSSICQLIFKDIFKLDPILKSYGLYDLINKQRLDEMDILKIASLLSKFNIEDLTGQKMMKKVLFSYNQTQERIVKLQCLSYLHNCHKLMFTSLFNTPSLPKHEQYITVRNAFLQFVIQTVLGSSSQNTMIRLAAFNIICRSFKLISNSKISDIHAIFYEPSQSQMEIIYDFIGQYIHFDQQESINQTTMMMASVNLENQQVRQQILQNLFAVLSQSMKIALNKFSIKFITKLLLSKSSFLQNNSKYLDNFLNQLIKSQILHENNNKFIYWRIFHEIILEIGVENQEQINSIISKLIQTYYKYKKGQTQTKLLLSNKLMLYLADTMDKNINNSSFQKLIVVKSLLAKTVRRFPKQTLQRLLIFFSEKVKDIQDKNVKNLKEYLKKISKATKKQKTNRTNSEQSSQQQKNESQQENKQNEESQHESPKKKMKQEQITIEQKQTNRRSRRTKRKIY